MKPNPDKSAAKRSLGARRAVLTRNIYGFEKRYLNTLKELARERPLEELILIAGQLWKTYYPGRREMPVIRFGAGTCELGRPMSYTQGFFLIELCPGERNILVLVHELVHARGPSEHGTNFARVYYEMLKDFLPDDDVREYVKDELLVKHHKLWRRVYRR